MITSTWRVFSDSLRCPTDRALLLESAASLDCDKCGSRFPLDAGFPDFREASRSSISEPDVWTETQREWEQSEAFVDARMQERNDDAAVAIYSRMPPLVGQVLDVGGSYGLVRRFTQPGCELLVVDPWPGVLAQADRFAKDPAYRKVCPFIVEPFAFLCGYAEALPIADGQFDFVHMRSMLDHASDPSLALSEAHRVLKPAGRVIIGLSVSGSPTGSPALQPGIRGLLGSARLKYRLSGPMGLMKSVVRRVKSGEFLHDHHIWHPSADDLRDMISDVGFSVESEQWQTPPFDHVLFIVGLK